ncbi:MarR family winged helix-turn-helix transcriptional regulator [Ectobacillus panaciterrae]|uniref:MarR family winged helix-turn-helix transcriptional regulator n=1 Tax=Ectobacillus panaciterrae TaxID=363872 RepID=UPI000491D2E4|nr:MarR family transcriptional regulator [Ectobacillus panaciterrae]
MSEVSDYIQRIQSALHITFQKMQPEMLESMNALGVTPTQLFVLAFLNKEGSAKVSQLAEKMGVKPSAVTFMVDRLEQHKLVMREHDTKDRRVVNISLTKQGEEKFKKILQERKVIVERYLSHLTKEELLFTAEIAEKLAQSAISEKE